MKENGNKPFFLWRKTDSVGNRYLVFGGKLNHPNVWLPTLNIYKYCIYLYHRDIVMVSWSTMQWSPFQTTALFLGVLFGTWRFITEDRDNGDCCQHALMYIIIIFYLAILGWNYERWIISDVMENGVKCSYRYIHQHIFRYLERSGRSFCSALYNLFYYLLRVHLKRILWVEPVRPHC